MINETILFCILQILIFRKRNKEQRNDPGRESTQSSRYKTVTYERRKSEVYAEIDEKSVSTRSHKE